MKLDEDPKIIDQTGAAEVCGDEYNEVRVFFRRRAQRRRIARRTSLGGHTKRHIRP